MGELQREKGEGAQAGYVVLVRASGRILPAAALYFILYTLYLYFIRPAEYSRPRLHRDGQASRVAPHSVCRGLPPSNSNGNGSIAFGLSGIASCVRSTPFGRWVLGIPWSCGRRQVGCLCLSN